MQRTRSLSCALKPGKSRPFATPRGLRTLPPRQASKQSRSIVVAVTPRGPLWLGRGQSHGAGVFRSIAPAGTTSLLRRSCGALLSSATARICTSVDLSRDVLAPGSVPHSRTHDYVASTDADWADELTSSVARGFGHNHAGADLAALPYTSGTTGFPKGVMLTHRNLTANQQQFFAAAPVRREDVFVNVLPYFHIYALNLLMAGAVSLGATQVVMSRFDMVEYLTLVERHKATVCFIV